MGNKLLIFIFALLMFILILPAASHAVVVEVTTGGDISDPSHTLEGIVDENGDYLPLMAGNVGQIIRLSGSSPHPPDKDGNPTGLDIIIGTFEVGDSFFLGPDGCFDVSITAEVGNKIICRVWNAPNLSLATYYGNSEIYTVLGAMPEKWDINGTINEPAFHTNLVWDVIPPSPPTDFIATPEASGDIILTWTMSSSPDCVGTRIVWRTDRSPTMEWDCVDSCSTEVSTFDAQAFRHTGLTNGTTYEYAAFAYDLARNFSSPAVTTSEVSKDTLPPNVIGWAPTGTSVDPTHVHITIAFDDAMNHSSVEGAVKGLSPLPSASWSSDSKVVTFDAGALPPGTTYRITVETTAADKAFNQLTSPVSWEFRTAMGLPPLISDLKIDGWKQFPGEIISPHPKVSATISDMDSYFEGIVTVEIWANGFSYGFTTPELGSVFRKESSTSGYFDGRFPTFLPAGTYTITLRAYDANGNSSEESITGLKVSSGVVEVINKDVYAYPSEFESGKGTLFAYKLNVASNIEIYVYSAGGTVFKKKISAGEPGGLAGYNEVAWDGLSSLGNKLSNGLYVVIIANGDKRLAKLYIKINNPP